MRKPTPEEIDAVLPQTQCGLCGHGGCMPYAEALIFSGAEINLCPPGGIPVLHQLGKIMNVDASPYESEMREKAKPKFTVVIREDECIGCTKCIQACPVDAILGSAKTMHTVIQDECTGCELCISPCPVDCIDLIEISQAKLTPAENIDTESANHFRERFLARENRLKKEKKLRIDKQQKSSLNERKSYVLSALERTRTKKSY